MQLGYSSDLTADVWTASKWLEVAPMGTIVRNGCDSDAPQGEGVHLIKVQSVRDDCGYEWAWYTPGTGQYRKLRGYPIRSKDIFLPIQVVKRGDV